MTIKQIANRIDQAGGRAFLIGGAVRDQVLGKPSKDLDVEVHGMDANTLVGILSEFGQVNSVGASFGVLKLTIDGEDFDFSLPRRENKTGRGHRGFMVEVDPTMTTLEAARRRDFTMNGLMQDVLSGDVTDHFGGTVDLENHTLKMTDAATFIEDPLRVLRGFQFCGRFVLKVEPETSRVCWDMVKEFGTLAVERVWEEWNKWATKSVRPSLGLQFLHEVGWLHKFPEVAALVGLEQEESWHPELTVFRHICLVVDKCAQIAADDGLTDEQRAVLVFAGLCHDFGKATTTEVIDGRITSRGHDQAAEPFVRSFMSRIGAPRWLVEQVVPLCANHMFRAEPTPRNVRRLSVRVSPSNVEMLVRLMHSDLARKGSRCRRCRRPLTDPDSVRAGIGPVCATKDWHPQVILNVARENECSAAQPEPVLMGRHLLSFMAPGPEMGRVLRDAFMAQLDGEFCTVEGGTEWVRKQVVTNERK